MTDSLLVALHTIVMCNGSVGLATSALVTMLACAVLLARVAAALGPVMFWPIAPRGVVMVRRGRVRGLSVVGAMLPTLGRCSAAAATRLIGVRRHNTLLSAQLREVQRSRFALLERSVQLEVRARHS